MHATTNVLPPVAPPAASDTGEAIPHSIAQALFRDEVLAPLRARLHGEPLASQATGPAWPAMLFGLLCVALPVFVGLAGYARIAEVAGTLVPSEGLLRLSSPQSGVLIERRVDEGAQVQAEALLFTLSGERSGAVHGIAERAISASMLARRDSLAAELERIAQQARERAGARARDHAHWQEEQLRAELEQDLQAQRVQLAESLAARYAQLQRRGMLSVAQSEQSEADALEQRQRLADLQRADAARRHAQVEAERQLRELQWQADHAAAALRRELAQLDEGRVDVETRRAWQVRAPRAGTVTGLLVEAGQSVAAGQPLASLVPAQARLEAELLAPSRAVGQLRRGQPVQLRYQAFPYQKFGLQRGVVRDVSAATLPSDGRGEPVYRVRVSLESQVVIAGDRRFPLLPGAAVEARVLLERRRLVEWLLEPVLGLRGRL